MVDDKDFDAQVQAAEQDTEAQKAAFGGDDAYAEHTENLLKLAESGTIAELSDDELKDPAAVAAKVKEGLEAPIPGGLEEKLAELEAGNEVIGSDNRYTDIALAPEVLAEITAAIGEHAAVVAGADGPALDDLDVPLELSPEFTQVVERNNDIADRLPDERELEQAQGADIGRG